ncbi:hypothetical protein EVAR_20630_1 [Eumeta japonica]|uniref:Uncharacterized protein n=1 Tax=Eumeta variegata TaxID=151549 RepID=A0A4C1VBX8_EUMVA|nr:hypothetical protein EVAR_20630_1 [Eumeta japonica]
MNLHRQSYVSSTTAIYHEKIIREYEIQIQEYEDGKRRSDTIINQLQAKLNEKKKLLKTLLEEQDQNSIEFEKLCKENLMLKRNLAQVEARNIDLQNDIFNITATNISLTEEQEQMSNLNKSTVAPLKQQLNELTNENYYLQTKLKYVINEYEKVKEQNKLEKIQSRVQVKRGFKITKNRNVFINLKKQKKKFRNLEKRYFIILEKMKRLNIVNTCIINLEHVEHEKQTTETNAKQKKTDKRNVFTETLNTTMTSKHPEDKPEKPGTCEDKSVTFTENTAIKKPKIYIFSDNIGRGLVGHMVRKLSNNFELFNSCKPDAKIENLVESLYKIENKLSDQDTLISESFRIAGPVYKTDFCNLTGCLELATPPSRVGPTLQCLR